MPKREVFDPAPKTETQLSLKSHYRSGQDNLGEHFFLPCLRIASRYRRAVGYFSSTSLLSWADALPRVATEGHISVQIIASPELSAEDVATLKSLHDLDRLETYQTAIVDRVLEEILALLDKPTDVALRARVFAWLIANGRLKLKFAFPDHVENPGIFHEKIGIFDFADGTKAAFTGSANETASGHRRNYESIDVYRSWVDGEDQRVKTKVDQFEEAWNGLAFGLKVVSPSTEILSKIIKKAPKTVDHRLSTEAQPEPPSDSRWAHQDTAVEAFLEARAGILEMATGTGKTRTALKILDRLIAENLVGAAIITMDGTDLLDQWSAELEEWNQENDPGWLIYRHYERYHDLSEFTLDTDRSIIVISRGQLSKLLNRLTDETKSNLLIVHDEVHGLGTPSLVETLSNTHGSIGYRLGLSATPDRAYDQEGNAFVAKELGPVLFKFSIEEAIQRGVLSEFDYISLPYELTDFDRERLQSVYARKAARAREGNPMRNEELWTEIAKVYKTAEMKPVVFRDFLNANPKIIERCILFVETKEYGVPILEMLHEHTHLYRTYYAEDDRAHLIAFAKGEIDCLITCHRISQGIDIQSLKSVVLFASARARLETIQRIGRCLRIVRPASPADPSPNADQDRCKWLSELSLVRKEDVDGT